MTNVLESNEDGEKTVEDSTYNGFSPDLPEKLKKLSKELRKRTVEMCDPGRAKREKDCWDSILKKGSNQK